MILCEDSCRASFDIEKVDALDMDKKDDDNASDKDSEGNAIEKMPQKKIRKFVAEREHKGESEMKNPNQNGKDLKNEMGTKIEEAAKSETRASPLNQVEEESEGTKELTTEEKGEKLDAGITRNGD